MKKFKRTVAVICAIVLCFGIVAFASTSPLTQLFQKGIIEGYPDGELHPEAMLTRAEFSKMLYNAFPDASYHQVYYEFSDLPKEHWGNKFIQCAVNAGWLKGYPDGLFKPDSNITYEEAVTVVCRSFGIVKTADYPTGYLTAAMDAGLTDNMNVRIGESICREPAGILLMNAITYKEELEIDDLSSDNSQKTYYSTPSASSGGITADVSSASGDAIYEGTSVSGTTAYGGGSGGGGSAYYNTPNEGGYYYPTIPYPSYPNTEEYDKITENGFKSVATDPLSTFSIDTDTASYSNLRRMILGGQTIKDGAVRVEEMINYFDYTPANVQNDTPFSVNYTYAKCPWNENNNLLMLTVSGEELSEPMPSNLVFLVDVSGSMYSYNKLPLVKKALSMLLDKLGENDRISIVTYASGTSVALTPTPATEKDKILSVIDNLRAGGGTAGADGIQLAYNEAEKAKIEGGNNRIILCTDGDFNIGMTSNTELENLITEKRNNNIFLSVLGFGMGNYKDNRMEMLADKGNGNYAYIDNLKEAKKVLVDEMSKTIYTIAKDVKIQTEFNPEHVAKYRLVGYENRLLSNEDFTNDKKDAGELGAGATVTVLYEIVPQTGKTESDLKYQTSETTGSDELMTVKIRYKEPTGDVSTESQYPVSSKLIEESEDFKFASAVAMLGMELNNSEFKGNTNYDMIMDYAKSGIGEDKFGLRAEFMQLVDLYRYMQ